MSSGANVTMETMQAEGGDGRRWFQLYLPVDRARWEPMVREAQARGFEAMQVTVDTAVAGKRQRDLNNRFGLPLRWTPQLIASIAARPGWIARMAPHGPPRPAVMEQAFVQAGGGPRSAALLMSQQVNAGVDWEDLKRLRDLWPLPLMVKGIVDPRQIGRAVVAGYDGVVVSNHGGRQLDGSVATIEMLPEIIQAASGRLTVLVDGGFRSGSDILKALALGADAVQLGRATLFGLAAGGQHGVERALAILAREFDIAMTLCGVRAIAETRGIEMRGRITGSDGDRR
jgi:(S)-mandelate dehydrogenase